MSSQTALLVTLLLLSSGESPAQTVPQDLNRLQGEWTMVLGWVDGDEKVIDPQHVLRCTFEGNKVSFQREGNVVEEVTIRTDPAKTPKAIDGILANKAIAPGIYKLEAETFTLCYAAPGKPRPTDFNANAGSGHKLSAWKRPMKSKS
jgi:uncharacterized protein (TIGR03067 family)